MVTSNEQRHPAIITIFGISGDLAKRKLLPSLYNLARDGLLSDDTHIVGISRKSLEAETVLEQLKTQLNDNGVSIDPTTMKWLSVHLTVQIVDVNRASDYTGLKKSLDKLEDQAGICLNRLFYLAIPANAFSIIVANLGAAKLNTGCQHGNTESRLLIEKPFGHDTASASELIDDILRSFKENETYRIDHYLAKETVQNILTLRSQNPLFEAAWGRKYIKQITVRAYESIGIENRVDFYEQTGAFRDVIQSHLLQLLGLVTMKLPATMTADAIHESKAAILKQLIPPSDDDMASATIRGQYDSYANEAGVQTSATETYAAATFTINNDRWRGVPLVVETGKAMDKKRTEIIVEFMSREQLDVPLNILTMKLQPNEGIVLDVTIKRPGFSIETEIVPADFYYKEWNDQVHPDAYERVLADALNGDRTLFATSEEVLACWKASQTILDAWQKNLVPLVGYKKGSSNIAEPR